MFKHYTILMIILFAIISFGISCSSNDAETRTPGSTSVGGANILTGPEVNEDLEITETQTSFEPNQEFYFHFHNNMPFNSELVTVQLVGNSDEKILAESDYEVDPEDAELTDKIWFGSRGMHTIIVMVDGETRATREVLIE